MKMARRILLVATLIALGVWLWLYFFPNPEKAVRKRIAEIAETASFTGNEGNFKATAQAWQFASLFATNVEIHVNVPEQVFSQNPDHNEIMNAALGARRRLVSLKVEMLDPNILLSRDKKFAFVDVTARATVPGDNFFLVQELKITLRKIGGKWFIQRVETIKTLSRA